MGVFKKFAGLEKTELVAERLIAEAHARASRGERRFSLRFTQTDVGARNSASTMAPIVTRKLAKAGFDVDGGERGGFGDPVTLHVSVPPGYRA
ncbi:MAG: hypothetical protein AAGC46_02530 [Solirubrobacteraceae bacterium]